MRVTRTPQEVPATETVNAIPLPGADGQPLGILLVASSRQIYTELRGQIRSAALLACRGRTD